MLVQNQTSWATVSPIHMMFGSAKRCPDRNPEKAWRRGGLLLTLCGIHSKDDIRKGLCYLTFCQAKSLMQG